MPDAITLTEAWDTDAIDIINRDIFGPLWLAIPQRLRVRTGTVPGTKGTSLKTLGIYVPAHMHADRVPSIYTSPLVGNQVRLLDVLVHEGIHAIRPTAGHKVEFGKIARAVGLEGKLTATFAGRKLRARLEQISDELGPRPHSPIDVTKRTIQKTYMVKASCPSCDRFVRGTLSQLAALRPMCGPCGMDLVWEGGDEE